MIIKYGIALVGKHKVRILVEGHEKNGKFVKENTWLNKEDLINLKIIK